jgi:hypothetical protein
VSGRGDAAPRRLLDHPATRLAALVIALGAAWALWRLPTPQPGPSLPVATARPAPPAAEACETVRRAEIEALRASGEVTAEMAMRLRQAIAQECAAPR